MQSSAPLRHVGQISAAAGSWLDRRRLRWVLVYEINTADVPTGRRGGLVGISGLLLIIYGVNV